MKRSKASTPNLAMEPSILSIPDHILMEILSKLPMTTLSNCRSVCLYFRKLISDPEFAQLHLSRSQPSLLLRSYWVSSLYLLESIDPCIVNNTGRIRFKTLSKFKPKSEVPTKDSEVLSSCNGLICLYWPNTYNPYVVCNPVINEYEIVPQMDKCSFDHRGSGFGFCPRTNRYKVLRFLSPSVGIGLPGLMTLEAEINTVGSNSWRRVGGAPLYLHLYSGGCFLNGALHWIVHGTENCFESMRCFDFGKERFQPFPGPSQFYRLLGQLRVDTMKMEVLKDGLSISHSPTNDKLDIWVMKDYAVQDSWMKDFVIEIPWAVKPYCGDIYQPLVVSINGDILMQFALCFLVFFNMRDRTTTKVRVNGIRPVYRAMIYIPSFVSIKNAAIGRHS